MWVKVSKSPKMHACWVRFSMDHVPESRPAQFDYQKLISPSVWIKLQKRLDSSFVLICLDKAPMLLGVIPFFLMVKAVNPPSVYGDSRLKGHEKMGVVHPEGAIIDLAMEDPQIFVTMALCTKSWSLG